jgi:hypothetical protein
LRPRNDQTTHPGYNGAVPVQKRYLPFIVLSLLALLAGLWAGLLRLGWALPAPRDLAAVHGPLMVSGFLGVLIPLERAVALRKRWMLAAPVLAGLGWILLLAVPGSMGAGLFTLGALVNLGILLYMLRREPQLHTLVMAAGAFSWLAGSILWLSGVPLFRAVFWWMAFLVLTIAGERLELNRVLRLTPLRVRAFGLSSALVLGGAVLALFDLGLGTRLTGAGLLALGLWFLPNDIAARNLRHPAPLTRYIAFCLFGGFIWLLLGGALMLAVGAQPAGLYYDAFLHMVFIGFVGAMIFGHAPIIFPSLLQVQVVFHPAFYLHLALLHLSLVGRVVGDLAALPAVRQWGGLFNEVALLFFLAVTVAAVLRGARS